MAKASFKVGLFVVFFIIASGFILDAEAKTRATVDWCQKEIECEGACALPCRSCVCNFNKCVCDDQAMANSEPAREISHDD
uniref:Bowman-Birk serine protease inhibitors family domain-containing protein n=1 Tax=Salix viminalis TaxID=40686 RepID=A0A6N2K022_SALVM